MKERPILFSTPMVQAILDGRKTVTRRVVGTRIEHECEGNEPCCFSVYDKHGRQYYDEQEQQPLTLADIPKFNRYGQPGDVLYVREVYYDYGLWEENGHTKTGKRKWKFVSLIGRGWNIRYAENPPEDVKPNSYRKLEGKYSEIGWYKRLGRFMPYRYVRTKLEIVSIRVERLHDITEEDAIREGIYKPAGSQFYQATNGNGPWGENPVEAFQNLWKKINGQESWDSNVWVWRIEFKKL